MYKKYKIKKRIKINLSLIIFIISISFLFMSGGYALFSENLTIVGKANVLSKNDEVMGKSTYNYSVVNRWGVGSDANPNVYQVKISITNHDGDLSSWRMSFDVQDGIIPSKINSWATSSTKVSGNTITMICQPWNANVVDGGKIEIEFQLPFLNMNPMSIKNLKFNDKLIDLSIE